MIINKYQQLLTEVFEEAVQAIKDMKFDDTVDKACKMLNLNGVQANNEQVRQFFVQYNMKRQGVRV